MADTWGLFGRNARAAAGYRPPPGYLRSMAKNREPTIRGRQVGERLLQLMAQKHFSVREVARRLDVSAQWVSQVTRGTTPAERLGVARILAVLGVVGDDYDELMSLCDDIRKPGLLEQHGSRLSSQLRTLIWHEERATAIAQFHGCTVPGLLQTSDYAHSLITETGNAPTSDIIDERVFARMSRQVLLTRKPLITFDFYIHEFALRLPVGREVKEVMCGQLNQLLMLSSRPNIRIRVVPASRGGHPASAGHFKLIESSAFNPVVYIDS
jgi:transcriptional regulator with XRE-family HTH domain